MCNLDLIIDEITNKKIKKEDLFKHVNHKFSKFLSKIKQFLKPFNVFWLRLVVLVKNSFCHPTKTFLKTIHAHLKQLILARSIITKQKKKIKKEKFKQNKSKLKFKLNRMYDNILLFIRNIIKFILNIDIGFIFVFCATYLFNSTYDWRLRLVGSFGLYYVYNLIIKNIKEFIILNRKN